MKRTGKRRKRGWRARKALVLILAVATVLSMTPLTGLAADPSGQAGQGSAEPVRVELSKTATQLEKKGDGYVSHVTLSVPAAEEKLTTDVVFVLDKSSFSNTKEAALALLTALREKVAATDAKVNVGVVQFNRTGHSSGFLDLEKQYDQIEALFTQKQSGGTNMHAGLLAAKELLESDTKTPDSRKYFILVSDGDTYLHCKDGDYTKPFSRAYTPFANAAGKAYGGFYDTSWYVTSDGRFSENAAQPKTGDTAAWDAYLADVEKRNQESQGDKYDFEWRYYDEDWANHPEKAQELYIEQPRVPRSASNIDMVFLTAACTYQAMAAKYHGFATAVPSLNTADGGSKPFMDYLNGNAPRTFDGIKNELLYLLGEGTTVESRLGFVADDYDFDLVDPDKMKLTLSGTENVTLTAEKIGENTWGFGKKADGTPRFTVKYVPGAGAEEKLVWTFGEDLSNFSRVSLEYDVKLTNPKTAPGTYGTFDFDGSKGYSSLYPSTAELTPVDSQGETHPNVAFPQPTVSYTIPQPTPVTPSTPADPDPITVGDPPVHKLVTGDAAKKFPAFHFSMTPVSTTAAGLTVNDMPLPPNTTVTVTGQGSAEFGDLTFKKAGTYVYEIREMGSSAKGWSSDSTVYTVTYVVERTADNKLTCKRTIMKDGAVDDSDFVAFTNTYTAPSKPDKPDTPDKPVKPDKPDKPVKPSKPDEPIPVKPVIPMPVKPVVNPDQPKSGDSSDLPLAAAVLGTSAALLAFVLVRRRRAAR